METEEPVQEEIETVGEATTEEAAAGEAVEEIDEVPEATEGDAAEPETTEENKTTGEKVQRLFVGNIAYSLDEAEVRKYFEDFGEIVDFQIMKRRKIPGESKQAHRGFGFIRFKTSEATEKVRSQTHTLGGKDLNVNEAKEKLVKFFVGGIGKDTHTEEKLKEYFQQFGEIKDCFVLGARGFGFVTIVDEGSNLDPIHAKENHEICGRNCDVKVARPKDKNGNGRRGRGRGGRRGGRGRGRGGFGGPPQWGGYGGWGYGWGYPGYGFAPY